MENKAEKNRVEALKKMLDPANWPVRPDNVLLIQGEVWSFETDDPLEENIYRPLFRWSDKFYLSSTGR
jgi:aspartyl/asparaginyl beta-hydroxylase (cupin superfamily)